MCACCAAACTFVACQLMSLRVGKLLLYRQVVSDLQLATPPRVPVLHVKPHTHDKRIGIPSSIMGVLGFELRSLLALAASILTY